MRYNSALAGIALMGLMSAAAVTVDPETGNSPPEPKEPEPDPVEPIANMPGETNRQLAARLRALSHRPKEATDD